MRQLSAEVRLIPPALEAAVPLGNQEAAKPGPIFAVLAQSVKGSPSSMQSLPESEPISSLATGRSGFTMQFPAQNGID